MAKEIKLNLEEETNNRIEKADKQYDHAKKIIDTTKRAHSDAHREAEKVITKDGIVDYSLLKDPEIREKFKNAMASHYTNKTEQYFKADTGGDIFKENALMSAYANITKEQISKNVDIHEDKYDIDQHEKLKNKYMEKIDQELKSAATAHLREEDIGHLLKKNGLDNFLDGSKMTIDDAKQVYNQNKDFDGLTVDKLEQLYRSNNVPLPKYVKKDYKKAA